MSDLLAPANTFEDKKLFVISVRRNENRDRLTYGLLGGVAKENLRAPISTYNDAVEVLGNDCVIRGLHNCCVAVSGKVPDQLFLAFALWRRSVGNL